MTLQLMFHSSLQLLTHISTTGCSYFTTLLWQANNETWCLLLHCKQKRHPHSILTLYVPLVWLLMQFSVSSHDPPWLNATNIFMHMKNWRNETTLFLLVHTFLCCTWRSTKTVSNFTKHDFHWAEGYHPPWLQTKLAGVDPSPYPLSLSLPLCVSLSLFCKTSQCIHGGRIKSRRADVNVLVLSHCTSHEPRDNCKENFTVKTFGIFFFFLGEMCRIANISSTVSHSHDISWMCQDAAAGAHADVELCNVQDILKHFLSQIYKLLLLFVYIWVLTLSSLPHFVTCAVCAGSMWQSVMVRQC